MGINAYIPSIKFVCSFRNRADVHLLRKNRKIGFKRDLYLEKLSQISRAKVKAVMEGVELKKGWGCASEEVHTALQ